MPFSNFNSTSGFFTTTFVPSLVTCVFDFSTNAGSFTAVGATVVSTVVSGATVVGATVVSATVVGVSVVDVTSSAYVVVANAVKINGHNPNTFTDVDNFIRHSSKYRFYSTGELGCGV